MSWSLRHGDCLDLLKKIESNSIDSIVTDPPYGISFMGEAWDKENPGVEIWKEVLRVLKPGGHAVVFAGTRTAHHMGVALELAGFDIREMSTWVFYTGFPKSLNISKAIDKSAGAVRESAGLPRSLDGSVRKADGSHLKPHAHQGGHGYGDRWSTPVTSPSTEDAKKWDGWGTHLKPAGENWFLVRKPIQEKTIVQNVLKWGTGAINIDACRYPLGDKAWPGPQFKKSRTNSRNVDSVIYGALGEQHVHQTSGQELGRFPANIYYCPKPSRKEKEAGCESLPAIPGFRAVKRKEGSAGVNNPRAGAGRTAKEIRNTHKTVKPIALMRWLVRLVTPPGGTCIDPFVGSGTTGIGCTMEGFDFIGMDLSQEYLNIAEARIKHWAAQAEED